MVFPMWWLRVLVLTPSLDALNRLLRDCYRDPDILDFELRRMERSKLWKVELDDDTDEGRVVAKLPQLRPVGS